MSLGLALVDYSDEDSDDDNDDASAEGSIDLIVSENQNCRKDKIEESGVGKFLPLPKITQTGIFEEELNDEFLNKKATAIEKPPAKVKITIPSLSDFKDVDDQTHLPKNKKITEIKKGLLGLLPKPKSETEECHKSKPMNTVSFESKKNYFLIPDSVKTRKKIITSKGKSSPKFPELEQSSTSSDGEENEYDADFFSLDKKEILPEVSFDLKTFELVDSESLTKCESFDGATTIKENPIVFEEQKSIDKAEAVRILSGHKESKRRKTEEIEFIDVSDDQIMPNRNEWYRTALASSTAYQRRGIVDEEDQPGTRRKNQITYLANQALANDSELQAMWSENRANRRATQNKYGF